MKKKNDMAWECADRLKPFGKTIKDATDFYIEHLTCRKKPGRPEGSSPFAGALDFADIRKRVAGDLFKTALVDQSEKALRERPAKPVFDSLPSQTSDELRRQRQAEQAHITSVKKLPDGRFKLGNRTFTIKGDAIRFAKDRMKKHRRKRDATPTAYEHFLEHNPVPNNLSGNKRKRDIQERFARFLLTPGGKFTDAMANDIKNGLKKEGWEFTDATARKGDFMREGDPMEAIHRFARQIRFELRTQR